MVSHPTSRAVEQWARDRDDERTPRVLVEHFFRHESGRLCAVLTRSLDLA
jgi:hypothetical protein